MSKYNMLEQLLGKKVRVFLKYGSTPYRVGIFVSFDEEAILLNDNGKKVVIRHEERGPVEEMI